MCNKQKRKIQHKHNTEINDNAIRKSLSSEELQHIIANALAEAEILKQTKEAELRENEKKEWTKTIGSTPVKRFFRLMFLPKSKIRGDNTTFQLLKIFAGLFFELAKVVTLIVSVFMMAYVPLQYFVDSFPCLSVGYNIVLLIFSLVSIILSRIFRVAAIEVDKIEDRNLLFGIFASITSFASIIVAVIALIR